MTRRRLLAVTGVAPWPLRGGFSLRAAHLLEHLATEWDVTLIAACALDRDAIPWTASDPHEVIAVPLAERWTPVPRRRADMRPLIQAVDTVLASQNPAAALLWNGAEFLAFNRDGFPHAVADRIDCGTLEWLRAVRHTPWSIGRALWYARYERRVVRSLDATIVAGQRDARALETVSGTKRVVLIPNGVHPQPSPRFDAESSRPTIAFTGTLSYYANIDAVRYFVRRMWPAIQREVANARFLIVGRNPRRRILALRGLPGVEVRSDVADMAAVLQEAWLAIAPMRRGTGVKNKVLEAWAAGRPVVMTPLASNGLQLDDRMRELVASNERDFCEHVVGLLRDTERRHAYGNAAHTLVARRHSWRESGQAVSRLLQE
ncbi:MAG: glycosyltransferase [Gemmatimonadales bacterium]|nr:glycosyltransferase [Gemmatimonadales bacterium]